MYILFGGVDSLKLLFPGLCSGLEELSGVVLTTRLIDFWLLLGTQKSIEIAFFPLALWPFVHSGNSILSLKTDL